MVLGLRDDIAVCVLRTAGFQPVVTGRLSQPAHKGPHVVVWQKPRPGLVAPAGSEVELRLVIR